VGGEGDDPERVAPRGGPQGGEVVGQPSADGLVERAGEEHRRGAVVGGGRPRRRPDGLLVCAVHRLEPRELHLPWPRLGPERLLAGERKTRWNPRSVLLDLVWGLGKVGDREREQRRASWVLENKYFFFYGSQRTNIKRRL